MQKFCFTLFSIFMFLVCFCKHSTAQNATQYKPRYLTAVVEYSPLLADSNSYTASVQVSWQKPVESTNFYNYALTAIPTNSILPDTTSSTALSFSFNKPRNTTDILKIKAQYRSPSSSSNAMMLTPNNESSVTMKIKNGGIISIVINGRNNTGVSTYTKKAANFITTLNKETYEQRINISPNANPVKLVFIDEDTLATNNNNQTTFSFESWAAFNRAIGNDLNLPANAVLNAKITYFAAKYTTTKILVTDLSTEFSPE